MSVEINRLLRVPFPPQTDDEELNRWLILVYDAVNSIRPPYIVQNKSSNYSMDPGDDVILASGAIFVSLPSRLSSFGDPKMVKNIGASVVTVVPHGNDTIDSADSYGLVSQYSTVRTLSDATAWHIYLE